MYVNFKIFYKNIKRVENYSEKFKKLKLAFKMKIVD